MDPTRSSSRKLRTGELAHIALVMLWSRAFESFKDKSEKLTAASFDTSQQMDHPRLLRPLLWPLEGLSQTWVIETIYYKSVLKEFGT